MQIAAPSTRFRNLVDILDNYEKIDFMSLTEADQKGLLDVIPAPLRYESFRLIFPNGEAKSGSEALLELIVILPGGKMISSAITFLEENTLCDLFTKDFQGCVIRVRIILLIVIIRPRMNCNTE
jgi:hypothetical protein